jgi:hypothetical protein
MPSFKELVLDHLQRIAADLEKMVPRDAPEPINCNVAPPPLGTEVFSDEWFAKWNARNPDFVRYPQKCLHTLGKENILLTRHNRALEHLGQNLYEALRTFWNEGRGLYLVTPRDDQQAEKALQSWDHRDTKDTPPVPKLATEVLNKAKWERIDQLQKLTTQLTAANREVLAHVRLLDKLGQALYEALEYNFNSDMTPEGRIAREKRRLASIKWSNRPAVK